MLTFDCVPREFKLRSAEPEIVIQYIRPTWRRVVFLLLLSPFIVLFAGYCIILLSAAKALLTLDLAGFIYILSYSTDNSFHVLTFIFTFLLIGGILWYGSDSAFTVTELRATNEKILLTHKTLWRFYEVSIPSNSIAYFHQFLNHDGINGDSWSLEAVTNQRLSSKRNSLPVWLHTKWNPEELATRLNYRIVSLFSSSNRVPVAWLSKVLADFYEIEQRSLLNSL